ncbi:GNAT family N-acetyltransferase [Arthrobacter sp. NPDC090010]|uniref:GNAT family N-acetyltransferase n=1 Tax=Arthrobacter sp. NPDC090010 TaxID=3363942 RepID=UPI0038102883
MTDRYLNRQAHKVVGYVVRSGQLLVFAHDHIPLEVGGVQVPAGTVEPGETAEAAVVREVFEETGLRVRVIRYLGSESYDVRPAKSERHIRYFFHLEPVDRESPVRWSAGEPDPSDGSGPKSWTCWWLPLEDAHVLCAGFGARLSEVVADRTGHRVEDASPGLGGGDPDLRLRRIRAEDAPDVLDAFASDQDMNRQGRVASLADAETYLDRLTDPDSGHEPWVISLAGRLVGLVCVSVDEANRNGWFWYWMSAGTRGRGLVRRSAATVADWALNVRGLDRLELGHRVNNPASGGVARAAGFVKEGTERAKFLVDGQRIDVDTYGRLSSDPRPVFDAVPMIDA